MRARAKQANLETKKANEILLAFKKLDAQRELEADAAIAGQRAVLCCAMLCSAQLDCAVLCCPLLCPGQLRCVLYCAVLCCIPCHVMPCCHSMRFICLAPWQL